MSYDLLSFTSFADFLEYLDNQIAQLRNKMDYLEKRYETLKSKADKVRQLESILSKLVGEQIRAINEVDFMGIKVVVSARALDELVAVEETLAALKDTLAALVKVREVVSNLAKETEVEKGGLSLMVQTINGIPVKLLFKESETV
jgi:predicted component of type VI protein secretion system